MKLELRSWMPLVARIALVSILAGLFNAWRMGGHRIPNRSKPPKARKECTQSCIGWC
jgi:hypothetical protein